LATSLLALEGVNAFYGDSHVLHDVAFGVQEGRLLALLGRNGAGKTTCISTIIGFLPARSGQITFAGQPIARMAPEKISRAGIGLVPQGRRIFPTLTVRENLDVAARASVAASKRRWDRDSVCAMFPRLQERQGQVAGSLSGGEQQMLAIGRALMGNPRVLLLDEPSEGLAPQIVHEVAQVLAELKQNVSIVLVEQNLGVALGVADDVVLLNTGRVVFTGTCDEFKARQNEMNVHLGVE
jgi:branched-chain amino acid transport system ATP-binding protein